MPMAAPLIGAVAFQAIAGATIGQIAIGLAVSIALGAISQKLAKKPSTDALGAAQRTSRDRRVTIRQPIAPRDVSYGVERKGGVLVHMAASDANSRLSMVIALAGHEVEAIDDIYFDDQRIGAEMIDGDGLVTSGRYQGAGAYIQKHLGTAAQTADAMMLADFPGEWTTNHRLRGVAYIVVRLGWNKGEPWPNGIPNITAVVRGKKVYDPRTATTIWTQNPALIVADILTDTTYGLGADYATEIDETALIAAANVCDEFVEVVQASDTFTADASSDVCTRDTTTDCQWRRGDKVQVSTSGTLPTGLSAGTDYYVIPTQDTKFYLASSYANALAGTQIDITGAGSGTHTVTRTAEPRYTAGGSYESADRPRDAIQSLLGAMAGRLVNTGGVWTITAGAYTAPTVSLDEDDLIGPVSVQTRQSRRNSINAVKGTYRDPFNLWQPTDFPAIKNSTYLNEDNAERRWAEESYVWTQSPSMAQRLAKIRLEQARQQLLVTWPCNLEGLRLYAGATVSLTHDQWGWSSKVFEVEDWRWALRGSGDAKVMGIELVCRETASGVYDWNSGEETTVDLAPNTTLPDAWDVGEPGVPSITEDLYETRDKQVKAKAVVTWAASSDNFVSSYEVEVKLSADSAWTPVGSTAETTIDVLDVQTDTYDFRVRALTPFGASDWQTTSGKAIQGLGAEPADVTGLNLVVLSDNSVQLTWDEHADLDVRLGGRILVRHSPSLSSPGWTDSVRIGEPGYAQGNQTSIILPHKVGTYLVKAEDRLGLRSTNAVSVTSDGDSARAWTTQATVTEDPGFSGSHSSTTTTSSKLTLSGSNTTGTYTFANSDDRTTKTRVRLRSEIDAVIVARNSLIDDRTNNIDDWEDFDGTGAAGATAWTEFRSTDDDPAVSPVSWSAWRRFDVAEVNARAFEFRIQLESEADYNIEISSLDVYVETADT